VGSVEKKNESINLFYHILKFGYVWITCPKSIDFRVVPLFGFGIVLKLTI